MRTRKYRSKRSKRGGANTSHSNRSNCKSYWMNMKKIGDLQNDKMIVVALRDIKSGEELVSRYYSASWRKCFQELK